MGSQHSRFTPRNRFWYEDLVERDAALIEGKEASNPYVGEDLNQVNDVCLEISRESTFVRGGLLFFALVIFALAVFPASLFVELFFYNFSDMVVMSVLMWLGVTVFFFVLLFMIRRDCRTPKDTPVRFNRKTGKVEACEFLYNYNPFGRWRTVIKTFDWGNVQAEITKQAGFNGKTYMVRYALELAICKPGTNEVLERIKLKGNDVTVKGLYAMWSYIRRYMTEGTVNLPREQIRKQDISFRRSFFIYMPYLDPTDEGAAFRSKMGAWDFLIIFLTIWFFWMWIPMGICQYIAMRFAPEPQWDVANVVDITPV